MTTKPERVRPPCPVCEHPNREAIDAQLASACLLADADEVFGLGRYWLGRHRAAHLSDEDAAEFRVSQAMKRRKPPTPEQQAALEKQIQALDRKLERLRQEHNLGPRGGGLMRLVEKIRATLPGPDTDDAG